MTPAPLNLEGQVVQDADRHRHEFLETFLAEFLAEWDGTDIPAS